ncbi:hypothetical protein Pan258_45850 [Symmachiella dynata]|uniref:hypothetical protein n=1 Tax=Symmachiella dynata TaxID=2527995 RepID=UPI0011884615|nr:hypothetical protein [Symmachiella dynata]QDT50506.1 hypothetical protein Pan258_45850 [Symmachiella dynata]
MWTAISYVSSGVTLVAFLGAVGAWLYRRKMIQLEKLIGSAPEADRGQLVANALEVFHVDSSGLTKAQQYQLALEQIRGRQVRFQVVAFLIIVLAIIAASVTVYGIANGQESQQAEDKISNELNERESEDKGKPGGNKERTSQNKALVIQWKVDALPSKVREDNYIRRSGADHVYLHQARLTLNLSHGGGPQSIIVSGLKPSIRYSRSRTETFEYQIDERDRPGAGSKQPHTFLIRPDKQESGFGKWAPAKRGEEWAEARSDNMFDFEPGKPSHPRPVFSKNEPAPIEIIMGDIIPKSPGLYTVSFRLTYSVGATEFHDSSPTFRIYRGFRYPWE